MPTLSPDGITATAHVAFRDREGVFLLRSDKVYFILSMCLFITNILSHLN